MKAVLLKRPGGPDQLYIGTCRRPRPKKDELLVRVEATALNRADLLQREGRYPPPKGAPEILGLEMAGVVEQVGKDVTAWKAGDRVFGLLAGGGYAEYAVIHQDMAMRIPDNLSFEEAAALPEAFLTAFQALYWLGQLRAGERVLIHAGGSGVGTAAIQIVRAAGAHAFITASPSKHGLCRELGAELTINYHEEDFAERVRKATKGRGVDLILDFIGAPYLERNLQALARDGRLVLLATLGGSRLDRLDLRLLFQKRARMIASTLRDRELDYKIRLTKEVASLLNYLLQEGRVRPVIDTVYNWVNVADAHRRMEANRNAGKIVLRITRD
ncbi:NAD(P)H-quinone oxidoreductase [Rhodocaloribacter litoris]|uniref:NAD(P)H-quinone oxidoreductase n=1 Tax=Rhodocaloribacter litoris TaxID=2558931 RepID=UPI001421F532|nr:NAD(P)H-quinone oxidoreductase [Rhodocaloribacter litoris]QXD16027.1 NAD(P)H-quinone oxidoreductase [Rhodocaloribacter litoris]